MADAPPRAFTSSSANVPSTRGRGAPTSRDGPNIMWPVRLSRRSREASPNRRRYARTVTRPGALEGADRHPGQPLDDPCGTAKRFGWSWDALDVFGQVTADFTLVAVVDDVAALSTEPGLSVRLGSYLNPMRSRSVGTACPAIRSANRSGSRSPDANLGGRATGRPVARRRRALVVRRGCYLRAGLPTVPAGLGVSRAPPNL